MSIKYAIALPQLGRAASSESIKHIARLAEDLGFSDVWVNDHIGFAPTTEHPSPRMFDPFSTMATAAAVTTKIGIGSQITAAYYPPILLAKMLASIDSLSGGRLKIAIGTGWQPAEFAALGSDFATRGQRTDEIISILRCCWESGSSEHQGEFYRFPNVKVMPPPPNRKIPIWIAGTARPALDRAVRLGDGYHGLPTRRETMPDKQLPVSQVPALIRDLRSKRPDVSFCISMYTHDWDPAHCEADSISRERDFFAEAGVQHVVAALGQSNAASWMRSVESLASIVGM
jgi:probable F420-dependent oxidoreductase